jgi:V8-like Glu-specific endopeptidase
MNNMTKTKLTTTVLSLLGTLAGGCIAVQVDETEEFAEATDALSTAQTTVNPALQLKRQNASAYHAPSVLASMQRESICGASDLQLVNAYNGSLGPSTAFVSRFKRGVGAMAETTVSEKYCSGTLVSSDLFLTASHCVDGNTVGRIVSFNYERAGGAGSALLTQSHYTIASVVRDDTTLDFALLRLSGNPGATFQWTPVSSSVPPDGASITIIQHPSGRPKEIEAGSITFQTADSMAYGNVDTEPGSSGSGILDVAGHLIGVHTNGGCTGSGGTNSGIRMARAIQLSPELKSLAVPLWVNTYGYTAGNWRVESHPRLLGDVNGDGKQDIVGFANSGAYVSLSTGTGFGNPALWVADYGYNAGGWRVEFHPRLLGDVNGDGKQDIVGFGGAGVYVSLSTGNRFGTPTLWVADYGYNAGGWRVESHPRLLGDVNGDGKQDIVGFGTTGVYVSISTGSAFSGPTRWVDDYGAGAGGWSVGKHPRVLADVNRDGKQDVVGFGETGTYVSLSSGSSFGAPSRWVAGYGYSDSAGAWRVESHPRVVADVNGDGRQDIVGFGNAGTYVSLSNGTSFTAPSLWVDNYGYNAGGWRVESHPRFLSDVNGDGKSDVVGFGEAGVYVSESTGTAFRSPLLSISEFGNGSNAGAWLVARHPRLVADVTGGGKADVVGFGNAGAYVVANFR